MPKAGVPSRDAAGEVLFSAFDALFAINLPLRRDRRRDFNGQLKAIGLSLDHPKVRLFRAVRPSDKGEFPTPGTRGAFMSHLGVLNASVEAGLNSIIVCEDDLDFSRKFPERISRVVETLHKRP